jgi:ketosteroid isomerase-like protein
MPQPATPTEVFHALADGVPRLILGDRSQLDGLVALYAERTNVVHPFAPHGSDPLTSRADLHRHFAARAGRTAGVDSFEAVDRTVHVTDDPEVVIGEFRYVGSAGGRQFDLPCIFVLRVRNGEIVESRDYADHIGFARAFGRLEDFAAGLTGRGRLTLAPVT